MLKTQDQNIILSKFNNSPNFHKYSTTTTTFIINSPIGIIITPIHQQHVSKRHQQQLIMNPFKFNKPQLHYSSIFSQKHNTPTYMNFGIWIHYHQQLIIQFTCIIITSTSKHEIIHLNSNNNLIPKSLNHLWEMGRKKIMIED